MDRFCDPRSWRHDSISDFWAALFDFSFLWKTRFRVESSMETAPSIDFLLSLVRGRLHSFLVDGDLALGDDPHFRVSLESLCLGQWQGGKKTGDFFSHLSNPGDWIAPLYWFSLGDRNHPLAIR